MASKLTIGKFGASLSLEKILSEQQYIRYQNKTSSIFAKYTIRITQCSFVEDYSTFIYLIDLVYEDSIKYLKSEDSNLPLLIRTHLMNVLTAYKNDQKKKRKI